MIDYPSARRMVEAVYPPAGRQQVLEAASALCHATVFSERALAELQEQAEATSLLEIRACVFSLRVVLQRNPGNFSFVRSCQSMRDLRVAVRRALNAEVLG